MSSLPTTITVKDIEMRVDMNNLRDRKKRKKYIHFARQDSQYERVKEEKDRNSNIQYRYVVFRIISVSCVVKHLNSIFTLPCVWQGHSSRVMCDPQ